MSSFAALQGVKVLSLTQFLLGPSGVQFLSDLGADVIKVEPTTGAFERHWSGGDLRINGVSMFYMLANRNVKSVCLNLKSEAGRRLALQIAKEVDVVVQNFRPGVAERLGLGYESVKAANPKVIYASASGYGEKGSYSDLPGQDLLLQAMSGLAAVTGSADTQPMPVGSSVVDQHAASLLALGVLAALFRRERTGEGEHVQITMARAALDLQLESMSYQLNGYEVHRSRSGCGYLQAPYGIYKTAEGCIAISMSPLSCLANATGNEELKSFDDDRDTWEHKKEIADIVRREMLKKTARAWEPLLRKHGVWVQRVNSYSEAIADPVIQSLNPFETCSDDKVGTVRFLRSPIRFSDEDSHTRRFPAKLGQHTQEVLKSLGYQDAEIASLQNDGAIYVPASPSGKQGPPSTSFTDSKKGR